MLTAVAIAQKFEEIVSLQGWVIYSTNEPCDGTSVEVARRLVKLFEEKQIIVPLIMGELYSVIFVWPEFSVVVKERKIAISAHGCVMLFDHDQLEDLIQHMTIKYRSCLVYNKRV
jgi:hypothetical protein